MAPADFAEYQRRSARIKKLDEIARAADKFLREFKDPGTDQTLKFAYLALRARLAELESLHGGLKDTDRP